MKLRTFVFALPPYDPKSNGVHLYYEIAEMFAAAGHRVLGASLNHSKAHKELFSAGFQSCQFQLVEPCEVKPEWIPVFPDTSLPHFTEQFETKCRVWYLMNKPYALTGEGCKYRSTDLVLCYSKFISDTYPVFFFNRYNPRLRAIITPELCKQPKKNRILFYIGKCVCADIPASVRHLSEQFKAQIVTINRAFPEKQAHLWRLIKSSRLVVSTDPVTNLNYESTLLGTPCFIANNYTDTDYSNYEIPLTGIFDNETLLEQMYTNGIPPEMHSQILLAYDETTSNHSATANQMLSRIEAHVEQFAKGSVHSMNQSNEEINKLRLENDNLKREICIWKNPFEPDLSIGFSFQPYLGAFERMRFAVLKLQGLLVFLLLRFTTNTAIASECFDRMESFRIRARHKAAARSFYKQTRSIKK